MPVIELKVFSRYSQILDKMIKHLIQFSLIVGGPQWRRSPIQPNLL